MNKLLDEDKKIKLDPKCEMNKTALINAIVEHCDRDSEKMNEFLHVEPLKRENLIQAMTEEERGNGYSRIANRKGCTEMVKNMNPIELKINLELHNIK